MNNYLPTDYQAFIHTSRYARWLDEENRRETWGETVARYIDNVVAPKADGVAKTGEVGDMNLEKLADRTNRNVIKGSGDNR